MRSWYLTHTWKFFGVFVIGRLKVARDSFSSFGIPMSFCFLEENRKSYHTSVFDYIVVSTFVLLFHFVIQVFIHRAAQTTDFCTLFCFCWHIELHSLGSQHIIQFQTPMQYIRNSKRRQPNQTAMKTQRQTTIWKREKQNCFNFQISVQIIVHTADGVVCRYCCTFVRCHFS